MDVREAILKRLAAVAATTGASVRRMAVSIHNTERPAIVINDGDETTSIQKGGTSPVVVTLRPVLVLLVQDGDRPGESLNKLRAATIKAVLTDTGLATLSGVNGLVRYIGCETDVARGETLEASMGLSFEVNYVLNPADL